MSEVILILIGTVLVNNLVLTKFLGLCPFLGVTGKLETAIAMSLATTFVLTLSSALSYLVYQYVLLAFGLAYLKLVTFILIIALVARLTDLMVGKISPLIHELLGIFLPLVVSNCAILGVTPLNIQESRNFMESLLFGFGGALGFALVLILFAAIRERIAVADVPTPFQGSAIAMITAGIMSLAFIGFAGLIKG